MPLTDIEIRRAKPADRPRKLAAGGGLYLLLNPNGSRYWRLDYRFAGKRKTISMGTYPKTDLKQAEGKRDEARKQLGAGIDPGEHRKNQRAGDTGRSANSRAPIARASNMPKTIHDKVNNPRPLAALGIDDMEERAYRALIVHRIATVEEIANLLALSPRKAQRLLDTIESKGLATYSQERPPRYIATPPEFAVEALASQRRADIERACLTIPELKAQAISAASSDGQQIVEVITNRAALGQILMHLHQTAQHEMIGFQRAPSLYPNHGKRAHVGVHIRTISDASYIEMPGALNSIRQVMKMGEEARFFSALPVKMVIVDRRIGLIPLKTDDPNGPIMLLRSSALLDALCAHFEFIWERATPIVFTQAGEWKATKPTTRLSEAAGQLIPLLAAGLNDKAIAHESGMSAATLNRRIAELMKSSGIRTRFQLGWRAAMDAYPNRSPQQQTASVDAAAE
ncbi:integrase arm-type DNA-binding domain-containing protein [Rhodanobacter sp. C03]|uniref:integrase arm-type DNA-binding domain-containing protein n=1 Tax=Rhodanobacter sp. C03 TaxID=1945858 RepID=UPI0009852228|nr:integrase arm-type DNA-binding domain-containing protein [Rhodanobacter sp. C03]OOG57233.1 hypothetical protein B0E48_07150 [Rhodanobacter sp. C03]